MWPKNYKDYPKDTPLKKNRVEPMKGIVGCEMHESNGWGDTYDVSRKKRKGIFLKLLEKFISKEESNE